ncbi:MAG: hypothetical protein M1134_03455 [Actinobacteria bacterium]|nr:hypothetical protein [Actinomycetota bacterium]MCL5444837.1 hypothetical protein [Actinomycetota bacterium]
MSAVFCSLATGFFPLWTTLTAPRSRGGWQIQGDLWATQLAARALVHGDFAGIYTPSTALVSFPGITVPLAPAIWLSEALHWPIQNPSHATVTFPTGWLWIEIVSVAVSLVAVFAADALSTTLGVTPRKRFVTVGLVAVALWNVVVWWGHPEDALAIGFVMFATNNVFEQRWERAGWFAGLAVAMQPVSLLALPVLAAQLPNSYRRSSLLRCCVPSVVVLAGPLITSWSKTVRVLVNQPNYPTVDHTTWLTALAPALGHHSVAAGPLRLVAVVAVAAGGWLLARRYNANATLLVWMVAISFSVRVLAEPVMVAYYVWPVLAFSLVAAGKTSWIRLVLVGALSTGATVFGDAAWKGNLSWWALETALTLSALALAWPVRNEVVGLEKTTSKEGALL